MAKKSNQTIKDKVLALYKQIDEGYDSRLEVLFKILQFYYHKDKDDITETDINNCAKTLRDKYLDIMEDVSKEFIAGLRDIYGKDIDENIVVYHPWSGDGKDFDKRIWEHVDYRFRKYKAEEDQSQLQSLSYECARILATETHHCIINIFKSKMGNIAKFVEIVHDSYETEDPCSEECIDHLTNGMVPVESVIDFPPYHPDCKCRAIYYLDPKEEEVEG